MIEIPSLEALAPLIAIIASVAGIWLVLTALSVPGTGAPEIGALLCLIAVATSAALLPVQPVALLFLVAALGCFIAQFRYRRVWLLPMLGFALQALGSLFLFKTDSRPALSVLLLINLASLLYFVLVIRPGLRAQNWAEAVGADALIGARGEVISTLDPAGSIKIEGVIWRAHAERVILGGMPVEVVGREGLTLHVIPSEPESFRPTINL